MPLESLLMRTSLTDRRSLKLNTQSAANERGGGMTEVTALRVASMGGHPKGVVPSWPMGNGLCDETAGLRPGRSEKRVVCL